MLERDTGRVTLGLILGITIVCGLPVFLVIALFTSIAEDLDAPRWALGVVVAAYWVVGAVVSGIAGSLTVRIGARKIVLVSLAAAAVSLLGLAALTPSWPWFVVWSLAGGIAAGASQPGMNQLMTRRISLRRRPLAFGLKQSAVPLSTMLCGLAIPFVALTVGWRWAFAMSAVLTLLVAVAFLRLGPRRLPRGVKRPVTSLPLGPGQARFFLALACVTGLGTGGVNMLVSYGVVAAVERGIETGAAGFLLSAASAAGATVRILIGASVGRTGADALRITAVFQLVGVVGALAMASPSPWVYSIGLVLAFAIGWGWTGLIHLAVSTIAGPATPSATGIVQTGSYIGSAGGPLLAGVLYATWGDLTVWLVSAAVLLSSGILAGTVSRRPRPATPVIPG